ncbi:PREDICTED: uncharacterized protein LOC108763443 [Trachymyrmex cornetzi]|uniref:uncharacterized protein LOC108763443 n=1 Tax=Trachymyrmex cornetzi TaxID=471704 RepID=UPI00084F4E9B|nr:PREDICTED: uncharacterized protein LOC108763443 [Trachymyrmex cornetzi]
MGDWLFPTIQVGGARPCVSGSSLERAGASDWAPHKGAESLSGLWVHPQAWRKVKVVLISKTLEKLVDVYIRDCVLARYPLHAEQHAYRAGHSSISVLHLVVYKIEKQLQQGGFLVGTFLDIEGAFNNTPHEVVCAEVARRGVPVKLVKWIREMLGRQVTTSLSTGALGMVEEWCKRTDNKTSLVIFIHKYKVGSVKGPVLEGVRLIPETSVKYLRVILDKRQNWKLHLEAVCKKACTYFWLCRRIFGQTWGLQPDRVLWLYSAVLRPRLLYAAVVWWPRTQLTETRASLERVRALILRGALGAMRTTPVAAMGVLLGIEPLHLVIVAAVAATAYRLKCEGK